VKKSIIGLHAFLPIRAEDNHSRILLQRSKCMAVLRLKDAGTRAVFIFRKKLYARRGDGIVDPPYRPKAGIGFARA
jgi:hypothetical protein